MCSSLANSPTHSPSASDEVFDHLFRITFVLGELEVPPAAHPVHTLPVVWTSDVLQNGPRRPIALYEASSPYFWSATKLSFVG